MVEVRDSGWTDQSLGGGGVILAVGKVEGSHTVFIQVLGEMVHVWELVQGEVLGMVSEGGQAARGALEQQGDGVGEEAAGLAQEEVVHHQTEPSEVSEVFQECFLLISVKQTTFIIFIYAINAKKWGGGGGI